MDATYIPRSSVCIVPIDGILRVSSLLSISVIPTISDSSLSRQLDYDSGSLTLQPTIEHGLPAAIVNWYHNGQLIESGEDTLRITINGYNTNRGPWYICCIHQQHLWRTKCELHCDCQ